MIFAYINFDQMYHHSWRGSQYVEVECYSAVCPGILLSRFVLEFQRYCKCEVLFIGLNVLPNVISPFLYPPSTFFPSKQNFVSDLPTSTHEFSPITYSPLSIHPSQGPSYILPHSLTYITHLFTAYHLYSCFPWWLKSGVTRTITDSIQ